MCKLPVNKLIINQFITLKNKKASFILLAFLFIRDHGGIQTYSQKITKNLTLNNFIKIK